MKIQGLKYRWHNNVHKDFQMTIVPYLASNFKTCKGLANSQQAAAYHRPNCWKTLAFDMCVSAGSVYFCCRWNAAAST